MQELKNKMIAIKTDRAIVRSLRVEDVTENYVSGINDPQVCQYLLLSNKGQQTKESIQQYVLGNWDAQNAILFGIFIEEDILIGTVRLSGISFVHNFADIGVCIFSIDHWGKGYAKEAIDAVIKFAFNELNLHYLEAGAFEENESSIKLFQRCDFTIQYIIKNKLMLNNQYVNGVVLAKINN